ncbi:hypothetical protein ON010_g12707 [Phytophthora cinnamomi]|nr:hypothetical protein ON010_g12707 [Phytophthora cinnamomi]
MIGISYLSSSQSLLHCARLSVLVSSWTTSVENTTDPAVAASNAFARELLLPPLVLLLGLTIRRLVRLECVVALVALGGVPEVLGIDDGVQRPVVLEVLHEVRVRQVQAHEADEVGGAAADGALGRAARVAVVGHASHQLNLAVQAGMFFHEGDLVNCCTSSNDHSPNANPIGETTPIHADCSSLSPAHRAAVVRNWNAVRACPRPTSRQVDLRLQLISHQATQAVDAAAADVSDVERVYLITVSQVFGVDSELVYLMCFYHVMVKVNESFKAVPDCFCEQAVAPALCSQQLGE